MWLTLLGMLPGVTSLITSITSKWFDTKVQIFQAKTGTARDVAVAAISAQAAVQTKWWWAALPSTIIGFTIAIYIAKCILYDKVIGSFVGCSGHQEPGVCITFGTDGMSSELNYVFLAVVGSYFSLAVIDKFLGAKG
jgi:hypothetical protein